MKKKIILALLVGSLGMFSSMIALASPRTMPDGTVFDAEYYAQNNPDVVAVFGDDESLLYQHYVQNGKAEGRLAYAENAVVDRNAVDTSIRAQVNALGITYDPGRDKNLIMQWYTLRPISDSWHNFNLWSATTEEEQEKIRKEIEVYNNSMHYVRDDYTNDPLYLAMAQELMKSRELYHQSNHDSKYYLVTFYDQAGDVNFRDMDREYLMNVTSNLALDYMESILGCDLTWLQSGGSVFDCSEFDWVAHNKAIILLVNPSMLSKFRDR